MRSNKSDNSATDQVVREVLGYLNFSSGAPDPAFFSNLNSLFGRPVRRPKWKSLGRLLQRELAALQGRSEAFKRTEQAEAVIALVFDHALPAYRKHHRELLFHQTEEGLFQPFFIGRMCEAVLQQGGPWDQVERIVSATLRQLNDYLGHRPVAVLETEQKIEPYDHEWVRPIPLWVRGAGAAAGPYCRLVLKALEILKGTDPALLRDALFDPEQLDELAVDPRAYDFDHPVNKRPNYLFGQWDMGALDSSGLCRRFVVQEVSLQAMLARVEARGRLLYDEVFFEAAAVLAGTILMGSGVSGNAPGAHGSETTLAVLVQHIAAYRDAFYQQLIDGMAGPHAQRLRAEEKRLHQPFGGVRQQFNQYLARRRAEQLQHVHLARLFARMGYLEAATRQVRVVPVASARILCDIYCRLTTGHREIEGGRPDLAAALGDEVEELLHRGIECGALVDPWNILGFQGNYSLLTAPQDSAPDHRVDELLDLMGEIFGLYVRIEKTAAAAGNVRLQENASNRIGRLAEWWDQFASTEVGSVQGISGREIRQSADRVAAALRAWYEGGTAAGDIAFWRKHVKGFRSPKAYALVVEALLEQHDPVAAMALLMQWLGQAEQIPLIEEEYSFHDLALDWMEDLWQDDDASQQPRRTPQQRWTLAQKFLDYLEANAEEYWETPRFELADQPDQNGGETTEQQDEFNDLFSAAYEDVTYRDTTDDGFEGEIRDAASDATDYELVSEGERIIARLSFLTMTAKLWRLAAVASLPGKAAGDNRDEVLWAWFRRAMINRRGLLELLAAVHGHRIPAPRGTHESLVEYDRHRAVKETLLDQTIAACVETADAARMIRAAMDRDPPSAEWEDWEQPVVEVLRAALRGERNKVRRKWDELADALGNRPLLYIPLARGGNPREIAASRSLQHVLRRLLDCLPRLGLLRETYRLIETIEKMETEHPAGPGAVTEFDQMFQIGCKAMVRCLVVSSERWPRAGDADDADLELVEYLERLIETMLRCWLNHSNSVRLSVLEFVNNRKSWADLQGFIERYGGDLFTQHFMNLGNLRAILHQGVDAWLHLLEEQPDAVHELRLLQDLDASLSRRRAVEKLGLILEAVVENYGEYIDYNSTTTQSDRGEMLYTLLDFLRLRTRYERAAWNLQPVVLAHEVLVRCGRDAAAASWREAVAERTRDLATENRNRLSRLVRKYGMSLPSVAERLGEKFVRPLVIDRLRALVGPAVEQLLNGREQVAFARLEEEIAPLVCKPTGAGFEAPPWLDALEQEADNVQSRSSEDDESPDSGLKITQVRLSAEEVAEQIKAMADGE